MNIDRTTLIKDSAFSEETKLVLEQATPAIRNLRFITIGDLLDYCTKDGRSISSLLNLKEIGPEIITDIRTVLESEKLLKPTKK